MNNNAILQLDRAYQWWSDNRSPEQAFQWYQGFIEKIISLETDYERCPLAPENADFPFPIYNLHYGLRSHPTHRAIFTIRINLVYIFSIRHLAQKPITFEDF